jgi:hypothetical protein
MASSPLIGARPLSLTSSPVNFVRRLSRAKEALDFLQRNAAVGAGKTPASCRERSPKRSHVFSAVEAADHRVPLILGVFRRNPLFKVGKQPGEFRVFFRRSGTCATLSVDRMVLEFATDDVRLD